MLKIPLFCVVLLLTACSTQQDNQSSVYPRQLTETYPVYPLYARDNKLNGFVRFTYDVGTDGKVTAMRIVESSPRYLFDDAVIDAVSKWRFETNKPYNNMKKTIVFKINNEIRINDSINLIR